jgi:anti-sigma B factor antagonist
MHIREGHEKRVVVLDLEGKITIGEGDVILRETIEKHLQEDRKMILLNMARITYMDSSGIGELLSCFKDVTRQGGNLKLLNISTRIKDLLQITQLLSVFEYFDDKEKAVASFQ